MKNKKLLFVHLMLSPETWECVTTHLVSSVIITMFNLYSVTPQSLHRRGCCRSSHTVTSWAASRTGTHTGCDGILHCWYNTHSLQYINQIYISLFMSQRLNSGMFYEIKRQSSVFFSFPQSDSITKLCVYQPCAMFWCLKRRQTPQTGRHRLTNTFNNTPPPTNTGSLLWMNAELFIV